MAHDSVWLTFTVFEHEDFFPAASSTERVYVVDCVGLNVFEDFIATLPTPPLRVALVALRASHDTVTAPPVR
jgi:hypothetical protein